MELLTLNESDVQKIQHCFEELIQIQRIDFRSDSDKWLISIDAVTYSFEIRGEPEWRDRYDATRPESLWIEVSSVDWHEDEWLIMAWQDEPNWNRLQQPSNKEQAERLAKEILEIVQQNRTCLDKLVAD